MKKYIFAVMVALFSSLAYSQVVDDTPVSKPSLSHSPKKASQQAKQPAVLEEIKDVLPPPSKASLGFNQAARNANYDMMDLYLQQGADINCLNCDNFQLTALFRTLSRGSQKAKYQLADWLIQHGADINIPQDSGQTTGVTIVMRITSSEDIPNLSDFNYLDKRNADFKAVDSDGRNALHYVRSWKFIGNEHSDWNRKSIALVDQLVSHGVDVNHQDISGVTPLMNASTSCSPGSINLLLSYGADPALKDKLGKSALDRAMERATQSGQGGGCNEVVKILRSPQSDLTVHDDGVPVMVRIQGKKYEIGKYVVTQSEWKAVMGSNPSHNNKCGDNCPVEGVSWNDAQEYIQKLNANTGRQYRLPTEDEWEYACYGGSKTTYCGGNDLNVVGWADGNSFWGSTHPVGQKQANGYGLYDMT